MGIKWYNPYILTLFTLLRSKDLRAWYPFCEPAHSTGYSPNVYDETDASVNRLELLNATPGEGVLNGYLRLLDGLGTMTASSNPTTNAVRILGDITVIVWYRWDDAINAPGYIIACIKAGEAEADNCLYAIRIKADSTLEVLHEFGLGTNVLLASGLIFPKDGLPHMIMLRRDVTLKKYEISIDNGVPAVLNYADNPTGGGDASLTVGGVAGIGVDQADGYYYDAFVLAEWLIDSEITTFWNAGISDYTWFIYDNWDSTLGIVYVEWARLAHLYRRFILDAGAVYMNFVSLDEPGILLGATRGGNVFTIEQEIREMLIDGAKGPVKGSKRFTKVNAKLTCNFIEHTLELYQIGIPGSETTIGPDHIKLSRNLAITDDNYIDNIVIIAQVSASEKTIVCGVKNALADGNFEMGTEDSNERGLTITFTGHFDKQNLNQEPWILFYPG